VLQSGPLLASDGSERGSLIVFEADSTDIVEEFLELDPYTRAGLFADYEVHRWFRRRGNPYLQPRLHLSVRMQKFASGVATIAILIGKPNHARAVSG
jgi:hypothetical protein